MIDLLTSILTITLRAGTSLVSATVVRSTPSAPVSSTWDLRA
jgi:hypothetical protein